MLGKCVDNIQRMLARSPSATKLAVKLRNQCNRIVGYSVCTTPEPDRNGEQWLLKACSNRVECFFDVGANRGIWTTLALKNLSSRVRGVLFEPSRSVGNILCEKFQSSRQIEIVRAAVADEVGEALFYQSAVFSELLSLWQPPKEEIATKYS